jgi:superfamily II DNA/RNA helicase
LPANLTNVAALCGILNHTWIAQAEELHGNLTQAQRIDSLESFREGKVEPALHGTPYPK